MITTSLLLALAASPVPELDWHHGNLDTAIGRAAETDAPVLVYFWTDGSQHCHAMYGQTLQTEEVETALDGVVLVSANVGDAVGAALMRRFNVETMPTCLVLGTDGAPEDVILGYAPPAVFVDELARIRDGQGTVSSLRRDLGAAAARTEADFAARLALAVKLDDVGLDDESLALRESIRADDPEGVTLTGAELLLDALVDTIVTDAEGDWVEPERWDIAPVYKLAKKAKQDTVRYQAWNRAANLEAQRGELPASRRALVNAREYLPDAQLCDWSQQVTWYFLRAEDELTSKDYKFAVKLAADAVSFIEGLHMGESEELAPEQCWRGSERDYKAYLAQHIDTLAWAHYYSGNGGEAIELAKRCRELDPDYEEYQTREEAFAQPLEG